MRRRAITAVGSPELIALLPSLLPSQSFSVTLQDATHCSLTSPLLEQTSDPATFLEEARRLLKLLGGLIQIYFGSNGELRLDRYTYRDDGGDAETAALSNPHQVLIVTQTGLPHLQSRVDSGDTTCSELLSIAAREDRLGFAVAAVGNEPLGWYGIYDILEAMGKQRSIVAKFKAFGVTIDQSYLKDLWQTANHHRHRGNSKKNPLPRRKIELPEARRNITQLLQCWLEKSRPKPGELSALQVPEVSDGIVLAAIVRR